MDTTMPIPKTTKTAKPPLEAEDAEITREEFLKHFEASYKRNEEALKRLAKL